MGYKIMYNPEDNDKYPVFKPKKRNFRLLPFAMVLIAGLMLTRPQIRSGIEEWLIPGNPMVTKAAFSLMIDELREGESFTDAVTTFCNEIIAGGKTQTVFNT